MKNLYAAYADMDFDSMAMEKLVVISIIMINQFRYVR